MAVLFVTWCIIQLRSLHSVAFGALVAKDCCLETNNTFATAVHMAPALRCNGARIRKALQVCSLGDHSQQLVHHSSPLRVLGLDVNTNSTELAVVTEQGRVCRWGHIPTTQFASADVLHIGGVIDEFLCNVQAIEPKEVQWVVGIEAFMRMFRSGLLHRPERAVRVFLRYIVLTRPCCEDPLHVRIH
ncbi:hypothetical protein P3T76_012690 [Phytophthora citrophthora]|uniref:Secreted protein n=1 Tax=Phytophthora citrophthora TaxID=4793 RepID=A0AAD9G4N3_9STRA|nr:hypothetical protein P3T76_012690 [Phytophthora citrophthora]